MMRANVRMPVFLLRCDSNVTMKAEVLGSSRAASLARFPGLFDTFFARRDAAVQNFVSAFMIGKYRWPFESVVRLSGDPFRVAAQAYGYSSRRSRCRRRSSAPHTLPC